MVVLEGILKEVEIRGFRAVTSLRMPLTKINVLVGRNNTGKTTIIEALAMLLTSFNRYEDLVGNSILDLITQYRGGPEYLVKKGEYYAKVSATLDTGDRIALYLLKDLEGPKDVDPTVVKGAEQALDQIVDSAYQEKVREIEREIEKLKHRAEIYPESSSARRVLERRISKYGQELEEYLRSRDEILSSLRSRLRDEMILCGVSLANDVVVNAHLLVRRRQQFISGEGVEVRRAEFTDLRLQPVYVRMYREKILIERIDDLPIERVIELVERLRTLVPYFYDYRNGMIVFKFGERREIIPVSVASDGLLALLELFAPSVYGVRINLIEEPEVHMHPGFLERYVSELIRFVRERNLQYVMTTHSLEFLRYLLGDAERQGVLGEVSVVRLYRLPDGEVDYEVLSGEEAHEELEDIKGDLRGP